MGRIYAPGAPNAFIFSKITEPPGAINGDLWYDENAPATLKIKTGGIFQAVGGSSSGGPVNQAIGTLTIATDKFLVHGKRLILTTTQRVTIEGTGRLIHIG